MQPLRAQVKFFLENPDHINVNHFVGVFQRWIQQRALDELIIDVADYQHVFQGPGVILIGHFSDYGIENRDGRLGLTYTRKRQPDADLVTALRNSLSRAVTAAELLEAETSFAPRLKFRTDEIEIRFPDRLRLPNTPETFALVKDEIDAVLSEVYDRAVTLAPTAADPRGLFTVTGRVKAPPSIAELRQALVAQPG